MSEDNKTTTNLNEEIFRIAYEQMLGEARRLNDAALASASAAIRNLFLMHGGALIAMLAFTSTILSKEQTQSYTYSLVASMHWFAIGLALATAASVGSYLTNYSHSASVSTKNIEFEHPYIIETLVSKRWKYAGNIFHVVSIITYFVSLGLFIAGFIEIKKAFDSGLRNETSVSRTSTSFPASEEIPERTSHP